jgi:hypothetical protein
LWAAAAAGNAEAAKRCEALTALTPGSAPAPDGILEMLEIHGRLAHAFKVVGVNHMLGPQHLAELLQRDAANGYGIMAPSGPEVDGTFFLSSYTTFPTPTPNVAVSQLRLFLAC